MNINDLTIGEAKELAAMFGGPTSQKPERHENAVFAVGNKVFIRTVTHIITGEVTDVSAQEVTLKSAAWIADTGRFMGAIQSGDFSEVEPYPTENSVVVGRGALIDATVISKLPKVQK